MTSFAPSKLREIVRGQPDASLGQVEAEAVPHRPAQPGVRTRIGRPDAFAQAAEHDPVGIGEPGFERAIDVHPRLRCAGAANNAPGKCGDKDFEVVADADGHIGVGPLRFDVVESCGERGAVVAIEHGGLAGAVGAKALDHRAVGGRKFRQRMRQGEVNRFQRLKRRGQFADQLGGSVEHCRAEVCARIGAMDCGRLVGPKVLEFAAQMVERMRQPLAAGPRPRPT